MLDSRNWACRCGVKNLLTLTFDASSVRQRQDPKPFRWYVEHPPPERMDQIGLTPLMSWR